MKYPGNIQGPRFDKGDLVTFTFDGAELTLRLPIVPYNRFSKDTVSSIMDFRGINTGEWETDNQNKPYTKLVGQAWAFEDAISQDNIARFHMIITLVEMPEQPEKQNTLLCEESFQQAMLDVFAYDFPGNEKKNLEDPNWPALANRYHGESVAHEHLNWFRIQVCYIDGSMPSPKVLIPINKRFFIEAGIQIHSSHYTDGRVNPYSEAMLKEFEFNLFDEFLSHIDVRYTPETIAAIQHCAQKA